MNELDLILDLVESMEKSRKKNDYESARNSWWRIDKF